MKLRHGRAARVFRSRRITGPLCITMRGVNDLTKHIRRRTYRAIILSAVLLFLLCLALLPVHVFADTGSYHDSNPDDYITERFDVTASVEENHIVHYEEVITVNFIKAHHGITRIVPENAGTYEVRNLNCEGEPYSVSGSTIKIGDPDKLLNGRQVYMITYDLVYPEDKNVITDLLYIDLLPTGWETSIREAKLRMTMPKSVDKQRYRVYLGTYQATTLADSSLYSISDNGRTFEAELSDLGAGEGLTVRADLPDGYFMEQSDEQSDDAGEAVETKIWPKHFRIWLIFLSVEAAAALLLWFFFGRSPQVTDTVEFYPPENLTPAEIGYILNGTASSNDLGSMILYFADKGYLKIREIGRRSYELIKLREIDPNEKQFAQTLFNGIFADGMYDQNGHACYQTRFHSNAVSRARFSANRQLKQAMKNPPIYRTSRTVARILCCIFAILQAFLSAILCPTNIGFIGTISFDLTALIFGYAFLISTHDRKKSAKRGYRTVLSVIGTLFWLFATIDTAGNIFDDYKYSTRTDFMDLTAECLIIPILSVGVSILVLLLALHMKGLTKIGAWIYGKVLGFRSFIETAEYDRMKTLSDQDPNYCFHIMPYANVLGMGSAWAVRFANFVTEAPDWYESTTGTVYQSPEDWYNHVSSSIHSAFSSGSFDSGSSNDSGSVGGGGGGGGGGAW